MLITNKREKRYEVNSRYEAIVYKYELEEVRKLFKFLDSSTPMSKFDIVFNHLGFHFRMVDIKDSDSYKFEFDNYCFEGPIIYIDTEIENEKWPDENENSPTKSDWLFGVIPKDGKFYDPYYFVNRFYCEEWTDKDDEEWTDDKTWNTLEEWLDTIEKYLREMGCLKDTDLYQYYFPYTELKES